MTEINSFQLDGVGLTFEQVNAVAYGKPNAPQIQIEAESSQRVTRAANAVQTLLERGTIAYCVNRSIRTL